MFIKLTQMLLSVMEKVLMTHPQWRGALVQVNSEPLQTHSGNQWKEEGQSSLLVIEENSKDKLLAGDALLKAGEQQGCGKLFQHLSLNESFVYMFHERERN